MSKKKATSESTTKRPRRTFSDEYKIEAVKMVTEQGYKVAEAARSLGIQVNLLHTSSLSRKTTLITKNSSIYEQKINACEWNVTS